MTYSALKLNNDMCFSGVPVQQVFQGVNELHSVFIEVIKNINESFLG